MNGTHPFKLDLDMAKKYIDADILRKRIAKYYDEYKEKFHSTGNRYYLGLADGLDVAEGVVDSLQREQPCEDLTTEIEKYFQGLWPGTETAEQCNTDMHFTPPAIMRLAKHFYELGRNNK